MSDWLTVLTMLADHGENAVLVTIMQTKGSTPQDCGARMVVSGQCTFGTIGGGKLEYKCIEFAREHLASQNENQQPWCLHRFPLGPSLGQCCGGVAFISFEFIGATQAAWITQLNQLKKNRIAAVIITRQDNHSSAKTIVTEDSICAEDFPQQVRNECISAIQTLFDTEGENILQVVGNLEQMQQTSLYFESVRAADFHIMLFGAGHVGKALVHMLSALPCEISWIDSRQYAFPESIPANVRVIVDDQPEYEIDAAPQGTYFIVMTHSHPLDQAICARILKRGDFSYCGLIGSLSKRNKFEKRFRSTGISDHAIKALTCPIGVGSISGKHPGVIALAVATELVQIREAVVAASQARASGISLISNLKALA